MLIMNIFFIDRSGKSWCNKRPRCGIRFRIKFCFSW